MKIGVLTQHLEDGREIVKSHSYLHDCSLILTSDKLEDTVAAIKQTKVDGCILDNRFSNNFSGAKLVDALFDNKIPSILITKFPTDFNLDIRRYRGSIPIALHWVEFGDLTGEELSNLFNICLDEINGNIAPDRKLNRTRIHVLGINSVDG
jgi:hypothetical protein